MVLGIHWLVWVWQVLRWPHAGGWHMSAGWQLGIPLCRPLLSFRRLAWFPSITFQEGGGPLVIQSLELAQNPFCHFLFARKTSRDWETDSRTWWKAAEGCGHVSYRMLMSFVLFVITEWSNTCWMFHLRSVHELPGARTSLDFVQFLSKLCVLPTFLRLTFILIRSPLEPVQHLFRIQLSQASTCFT